MKIEVDPIKQESSEANTNDIEQVEELCEDMEMVSPGAMLREARKALSFSQQHIATTLNFTMSLVQDIEADKFDPLLPATFNRGYLTNYAKLVDIDAVDVLASYDALDAASIQRSEMLSFSKKTTKQAEHSRVMWISYLIIAVFIGLTIVWWFQEKNQQSQNTTVFQPESEVVNIEQNTPKVTDAPATEAAEQIAPTALTVTNRSDSDAQNNVVTPVESIAAVPEKTIENTQAEQVDALQGIALSESLQSPPAVLSTAVFTFKGDCWVNIFDAKGERIAWGVKKAGYVMSIEGVAPLKITVGKPELTSIMFNDKPVDMSAFNTGNIAKFSLPLQD